MTDRRTRLITHLHALAVERHPETGPVALQRTEAYLVEQLSLLGWETCRQAFQAWDTDYQNIVAVRSPLDDEAKKHDSPILLGAHYDTVAGSPGADDNASALVVLLEVALQLRAATLSRPVWIVAFCLEEQGLLGSRAFVSRLKHSGQHIGGAIVLECVGYTDHTPGSQQTPPGVPIAVPTTGNFLGLVGNEASRDLVAAVATSAQRIQLPLPVVPMAVPGRGEQLPDVRRSDHAAFWDEGYPAVMLTDTGNFRNPHYHQPTDTIDTLDIGFIEAVSETVAAAVEALAATANR